MRVQRKVTYQERLEMAEALVDECAKPVVEMRTVRALAKAMLHTTQEDSLAMQAIAGIAESRTPSVAVLRYARELVAAGHEEAAGQWPPAA